MANRDIVARMGTLLDDYEAGRLRPDDVKRAILFNIEALEALAYARIEEARTLCDLLATSHFFMGDEEFIDKEDVSRIVADFRNFLTTLPSGGAG